MVLESFDQEKYEKAMKQEGYEDGYQDGQEQGICQLITTLRELSHTREETARKARRNISLQKMRQKGI